MVFHDDQRPLILDQNYLKPTWNDRIYKQKKWTVYRDSCQNSKIKILWWSRRLVNWQTEFIFQIQSIQSNQSSVAGQNSCWKKSFVKTQSTMSDLMRCKSRELRGGILYTSCGCSRRNGLQYDCQRSACQGRKVCVRKPFPKCCPSHYGNRFADATMGKSSNPIGPRQIRVFNDGGKFIATNKRENWTKKYFSILQLVSFNTIPALDQKHSKIQISADPKLSSVNCSQRFKWANGNRNVKCVCLHPNRNSPRCVAQQSKVIRIQFRLIAYSICV